VSEPVLDSSVVLALLMNERIDSTILDILEGAVMSAVNFAEVWGKMYELGLKHAPRTEAVLGLFSRIEPFTSSQARVAGDLRLLTKHAGLSLGDRACLALALATDAEVYTADRQWTQIDVGCRIHLIR
jgi:ribonuclease VapC